MAGKMPPATGFAVRTAHVAAATCHGHRHAPASHAGTLRHCWVPVNEPGRGSEPGMRQEHSGSKRRPEKRNSAPASPGALADVLAGLIHVPPREQGRDRGLAAPPGTAAPAHVAP